MVLQLGQLFEAALQAADYESAAHQRAEVVSAATFIAKWNEWTFDQSQRGADHFKKYDVREKRQIDAIRTAWHEFDEEMKHAGY